MSGDPDLAAVSVATVAVPPSTEEVARPLGWTARALLLGPPLAGTLLLVFFALAEMSGRTPLSYQAPANIAEAAGMAMESEVLRFLREGQDPTAVFDIRPDIISSSVTRVTALEAAIWSRRVRLIGMLEREGAIRSDDSRQHLVCLAADIRADELVRRLAPQGAAGCEEGGARRFIEARSR
jgi:hypothetical protein